MMEWVATLERCSWGAATVGRCRMGEGEAVAAGTAKAASGDLLLWCLGGWSVVGGGIMGWTAAYGDGLRGALVAVVVWGGRYASRTEKG